MSTCCYQTSSEHRKRQRLPALQCPSVKDVLGSFSLVLLVLEHENWTERRYVKFACEFCYTDVSTSCYILTLF